jgi:hypothetical protein
VWWDRKSAAGQAFDEAIERELEAAKCIIVLWSQASIDSEWVKNEAAEQRRAVCWRRHCSTVCSCRLSSGAGRRPTWSAGMEIDLLPLT